jgi:hypothetical protein
MAGFSRVLLRIIPLDPPAVRLSPGKEPGEGRVDIPEDRNHDPAGKDPVIRPGLGQLLRPLLHGWPEQYAFFEHVLLDPR